MKIFEYAQSHPQEILAVTDDGEKIPYRTMNKLGQTLEMVVGHRLVFALCRNTPGSLLGYLGLLQSGGVPLLLDADIAPALLEDLVRTYRPAFCLVPENLPEESLEAFHKGLLGKTAREAASGPFRPACPRLFFRALRQYRKGTPDPCYFVSKSLFL